MKLPWYIKGKVRTEKGRVYLDMKFHPIWVYWQYLRLFVTTVIRAK